MLFYFLGKEWGKNFKEAVANKSVSWTNYCVPTIPLFQITACLVWISGWRSDGVSYENPNSAALILKMPIDLAHKARVLFFQEVHDGEQIY